MRVRIRALALAGVFALACCGCQKGARQATHASPDTAEAEKADAKAAPRVKPKTARASSSSEKVAKASPQIDTRSYGVLTEADNEMEFDFRQGQIITVVLSSNRSSGLIWALSGSPGSIIVPEGSASYAVRAGKNGGAETWRFRAARSGYQTVKMEYRRKWAQSVPERTFRFSGTVR